MSWMRLPALSRMMAFAGWLGCAGNGPKAGLTPRAARSLAQVLDEGMAGGAGSLQRN